MAPPPRGDPGKMKAGKEVTEAPDHRKRKSYASGWGSAGPFPQDLRETGKEMETELPEH